MLSRLVEIAKNVNEILNNGKVALGVIIIFGCLLIPNWKSIWNKLYVVWFIVWFAGICFIGATLTSNNMIFMIWLIGGTFVMLVLTFKVMFGNVKGKGKSNGQEEAKTEQEQETDKL